MTSDAGFPLSDDPLSRTHAINYEAPVQTFHGSIGFSAGDSRMLTQKLDYLHDRRLTAIGLLLHDPSPLRGDRYDIADDTTEHPPHGTLDDLQDWLSIPLPGVLEIVKAT